MISAMKKPQSKCPPSQPSEHCPGGLLLHAPTRGWRGQHGWVNCCWLLPDYTWLFHLYFIKPQRRHWKTVRSMNKFSKVTYKTNIKVTHKTSASMHQNERCWWLPGHGAEGMGRCWSPGAKLQLYRVNNSGNLMCSMATAVNDTALHTWHLRRG